jgi:hypothetical protein
MAALAERLVLDESWVPLRRLVPPTEVTHPQGGGRPRAGDATPWQRSPASPPRAARGGNCRRCSPGLTTEPLSTEHGSCEPGRCADVEKLLVDGWVSSPSRLARSFRILVQPVGADLTAAALHVLARELASRRREMGTRWRRLTVGRQALLVLAHLRSGHAQLADGFGVGTTTAYRYINEAIEVLAALAPPFAGAMRTAVTRAFVILDGTLLPIDRIAADRLCFSGKHKGHSMHVQVITAPTGRLLRASPALPGAGHDVRAARTHGIIDALEAAGVECWADKGTAAPAAPYPCPTGGAETHCPQVGRPSTARSRRSARSWDPVWPPLLIFSLVGWVWWVVGQAGVGEEGPWQLWVVVDAVDALFGGVGGIGEVVACEVGEFPVLERGPQQFHRVQLGSVGG